MAGLLLAGARWQQGSRDNNPIIMNTIISFLIFRALQLIYHLSAAAETLISGFLRYLYIPLFHSHLNHHKIVQDLASLDKQPSDQLTFVYEVRLNKKTDLQRTALRIVRNARIVEQAFNSTDLNCYLDTSFVKPVEAQELEDVLQELLKEDGSRMKLYLGEDFSYREKISADRKKITPLVVVFSTYPTVLGLHPRFLVGAEIAFKPQALKSTDYDLYASVQGYATSEQRKGK